MLTAGPLYAFSLFLPTIISELGYKSTQANLLTVPPYAAAAVLTVTIGFLADRWRMRGPFNIGFSLLGILGFAMIISSSSAHVKYAGVFLAAGGIYPCIANTIVWAGNNVEGVFKRGVVMGVLIGWGNLNGIMSSNIYRAQDKPKYLLGHGMILGYLVVFLFGGSVFTWWKLGRENEARRRGERDYLAKPGASVHDLGDMRPDFFYTL